MKRVVCNLLLDIKNTNIKIYIKKINRNRIMLIICFIICVLGVLILKAGTGSTVSAFVTKKDYISFDSINNVARQYRSNSKKGKCVTIMPKKQELDNVPKSNKKTKYIKINYKLGRGDNSLLNYKKIKRSQCPYELKPATCNNYKFEGWYSDLDFTHKVDIINKEMPDNMTLYAKWTFEIDNEKNIQNFPYKSSIFDDSSKEWLKYCDYSLLPIKIPGMPDTRKYDYKNNYIDSKFQIPQGICITNDYILVTAYSGEKNKMGSLFVFDKNSMEYLVTLGMDPNSHLGGIAFDGDNVWICNSHDMAIERISYDFIKLMATTKKGKTINASKIVDKYKVVNTPSSITYHAGRLWIVTHNVFFNSKLYAYYYNGNALKTLNSYLIPPQVQGIAFTDKGKVVLSTSYGRTIGSHLKIYNNIAEMAANPKKLVLDIEMPPGSESIDVDGENNIYVVFETASKKYFEGTDGGGKSLSPIDKILKVFIENI